MSEVTHPPLSPVEHLPAPDEAGELREGMALCLSGGGYRAMLFHVGVLWRLNDARLLRGLKRISSVSGGSITAGVLGVNWLQLGFDELGLAKQFLEQVVQPLRGLAARTLDRGSVVGGILLPGMTISDFLASAYDRHLFHGATLQALPDDSQGPRFVINATNVQSGALWRFMKPYMRDYRVGEVKRPQVPLALAVAASSAFPPILSPVRLELGEEDFTPGSGLDLQRPPFTTDVYLSDGGVYDNLGLETAWKSYRTILVSDAGGKMQAEEEPKTDWARHAVRVLDLVDNQVRSLRKRQLIDSYVRKDRQGAYWGIRTDIADYEIADALPCPFERTLALAETPTRLKRVDAGLQERLINWGYAVCDAALRKHVDPQLQKPDGFPYPAAGV